MANRKKKSTKSKAPKTDSSANIARTRTDQTCQSPEVAQAIAQRREKRAASVAQRDEKLNARKEAGNTLFQAGDYEGAVSIYTKAIAEFGEKPVLLSNLSAAYLKLELFEEAEDAASTALKHDPRMLKARYRRGLARKEQYNLDGALVDFKSVLRQEPSCAEAAEQLRITEELRRDFEDLDQGYASPLDEEMEYPPFNLSSQSSEESDADSTTSDCRHRGNGIPCRFYNHNGCLRKANCHYSHAPDSNSIRDELGKNVCLFFLLNSCKFGAENCVYSHDKTYLSVRWKTKVEKLLLLHSLLHESADPHGSSTYEDLFMMSDMGFGPTAEEYFEYTSLRRESPTGAATSGRFLSLMVLDSDAYEDYKKPTMIALNNKLPLKKAESRREAIAHLRSPNLAGVFVADAALSEPKYSLLLSKLVDYVKKGGSVVIGGAFSTFVIPTNLAKFFSEAWGVNWKVGDYYRENFILNKMHDLAKSDSSLKDSYSMKALRVSGIEPHMAVYKTSGADTSQSPAVQVRVGEGFMGYIGDVNWEEGSATLLLAMLHLSNAPRHPFIVSFGKAHTSTKPQDGLFAALRDKLEVMQDLSNPRIADLLGSRDLVGVFVTDPGLADPSNAYLLEKLVDYTKSGGTVVLGGLFAASRRLDKLRPFFRNTWSLPWACGDHVTSGITANDASELVRKGSDIPSTCSMKGLPLVGVALEMAVYLADNDIQVHNYEARHPKETLVAFARVGQGRLGYIGDTELEVEHTKILLAMFGLLP